MEKVLITEPIHPDAVAFLAQRFQVVQGTGKDPETVRREGTGCAGILLRVARISAETMDALPTLRVIAKHGVGLDSIDVEAATERGIAVVNAPYANINAVAEHTVALMLGALKHLAQLDKATREGDFACRGRVTNGELTGKTVGLVGLGRIARLVAGKLSGFGAALVGCDPYVKQEQVEELGIRVLPMDEVLAQADILSLHTPLTQETRHLIGAAELAKMKPTAILVNASRGPVLDEEALLAALRAERLGGAGLDVFEEEPPKADNPLFALENVVVSPHNAALTDAALRAMAMDSARGIADYLTGTVPEFLCNPSISNK